MPLKLSDTVEEPHLNLTPMIDIVFLLIIFFMVGTQFTERERQFDINLPTASDAQPLTALPDELVVNVTAEGRFNVGGDFVSLPELESMLSEARGRFADQAVVIRGDASSQYQNIMNVIAACHRVQIHNIALPVAPQTEEL